MAVELNLEQVRKYLKKFKFTKLFVELGWSHPENDRDHALSASGADWTYRYVAELGGVVVLLLPAPADGAIPDSATRKKIHREAENMHHEHLLIFTDSDNVQCLWSWARREKGKIRPRDHLFVKGQPGDLFLGKLAHMAVGMAELDTEGNIAVTRVAERLQKALDVEQVTKKFYENFQQQHIDFLKLIEGIDNERDRRWYASVLLNRLMFVWFLQCKGFLDGGDVNYLPGKLKESGKRGTDRYYGEFLEALFFQGFAKQPDDRSTEAQKLLGEICYLNGGLFLKHPIEERWPDIAVPDKAFDNLFALFSRYSWHLDDTPGGKDDEINPDVLGYIFEKYINQKAFGAYYTRPEITNYLCEQTIHRLILDRVNCDAMPEIGQEARNFDSVAEMLMRLDSPLCLELLKHILPKITILDPACGSGAFLVAASKTLVDVYAAILGKAAMMTDQSVRNWFQHHGIDRDRARYWVRKKIITDNLFGVDLMEEAVEICKLRLFLSLVSCANSVDELEPLPNIDFNIFAGNSLIGLMHVDAREYDEHDPQGELFDTPSYDALVRERNLMIERYRKSDYLDDLTDLRDDIIRRERKIAAPLDDILCDRFNHFKIRHEQAVWNDPKKKLGKPKKRAVRVEDIRALHPFHWGFEFDEVINKNDGFDIILTNPPWEALKPQDKEFFDEHSDLVTKNKMTIKAFEKERVRLLKDGEIRIAWLDYLSRYPHQSAWFRKALQYKHQSSTIRDPRTGKTRKTGSDINLYKLFLEQCHNLLRPGGQCGIVIPSGIYTDQGAKGLREMLFKETKITGLFGFENRKGIFEGVHKMFKFVVLTFSRGGGTDSFFTTFMRHDVKELAEFPGQGAIDMPVSLVEALSPDSLSVMEFSSDEDIAIARKMAKFPFLGAKVEKAWQVYFSTEFHMTNDSHLFHEKDGPGRLPLYEGKMIWQFDHLYAPPRYWISEDDGRDAILGRKEDTEQELNYQNYRSVFRHIARNMDKRTLIAAVLPPNNFSGSASTIQIVPRCTPQRTLFMCAMFNSFAIDWLVRLKMSTTVNFFYLYQLPVPRLMDLDVAFIPIVEAAARLVCATPEFDALAREAGLPGHAALSPEDRARLRADLDVRIARLYGLTKDEFAHILTAFPLVPEAEKSAALAAWENASLPATKT